MAKHHPKGTYTTARPSKQHLQQRPGSNTSVWIGLPLPPGPRPTATPPTTTTTSHHPMLPQPNAHVHPSNHVTRTRLVPISLTEKHTNGCVKRPSGRRVPDAQDKPTHTHNHTLPPVPTWSTMAARVQPQWPTFRLHVRKLPIFPFPMCALFPPNPTQTCVNPLSLSDSVNACPNSRCTLPVARNSEVLTCGKLFCAKKPSEYFPHIFSVTSAGLQGCWPVGFCLAIESGTLRPHEVAW